MIRVYPKHVLQCGYCLIPGARNILKAHGFDFREFVQQGIDADRFDGINDMFVKKVVAKARQESNNG